MTLPEGERVCGLLRSKSFRLSLVVALLSGGLACGLRYADLKHYFLLESLNPEDVVFNVFIVFSSLVATFRTSHALMRYIDAASLMHRQSSCWYDAVSTMITFTRSSEAPKEESQRFQELAIRLFSLLSGLCLEGLEQKREDVMKQSGHRFTILGWEDLDEALQQTVMKAKCKVEYVFHVIDILVMDGVKTGVLTVPAPLLARVFQELGTGLTAYHEAKKFSAVPMPYAYLIICRSILVTEALFVPFMLAANTRGYISAFLCTFGGTFLLWFMNGVAEKLDNPFKKEASALEVSLVQDEFNEKLLQLLHAAEEPAPRLCSGFRPCQGADKDSPKRVPSRETMHNLRMRTSERKSTQEKKDAQHSAALAAERLGATLQEQKSVQLARPGTSETPPVARETERQARAGAGQTAVATVCFEKAVQDEVQRRFKEMSQMLGQSAAARATEEEDLPPPVLAVRTCCHPGAAALSENPLVERISQDSSTGSVADEGLPHCFQCPPSHGNSFVHLL